MRESERRAGHTIRTHVTKMTGTITLTTRRDLRIMFNKDLKFTKTEEAGDRFRDPDPIVTEAVVNIWSQEMFTNVGLHSMARGV